MMSDQRKNNSILYQCPLLSGRAIDDTECYLIQCVSDGIAPKSIALSEAVNSYNFEALCQTCPNHRYD